MTQAAGGVEFTSGTPKFEDKLMGWAYDFSRYYTKKVERWNSFHGRNGGKIMLWSLTRDLLAQSKQYDWGSGDNSGLPEHSTLRSTLDIDGTNDIETLVSLGNSNSAFLDFGNEMKRYRDEMEDAGHRLINFLESKKDKLGTVHPEWSEMLVFLQKEGEELTDTQQKLVDKGYYRPRTFKEAFEDSDYESKLAVASVVTEHLMAFDRGREFLAWQVIRSTFPDMYSEPIIDVYDLLAPPIESSDKKTGVLNDDSVSQRVKSQLTLLINQLIPALLVAYDKWGENHHAQVLAIAMVENFNRAAAHLMIGEEADELNFDLRVNPSKSKLKEKMFYIGGKSGSSDQYEQGDVSTRWNGIEQTTANNFDVVKKVVKNSDKFLGTNQIKGHRLTGAVAYIFAGITLVNAIICENESISSGTLDIDKGVKIARNIALLVDWDDVKQIWDKGRKAVTDNSKMTRFFTSTRMAVLRFGAKIVGSFCYLYDLVKAGYGAWKASKRKDYSVVAGNLLTGVGAATSLAYAGLGVAHAAATASTFTGFASAFAAFGPPGWVVAGIIGVGLAGWYLTTYTVDSKIETWLQDTFFGNPEKYKNKNKIDFKKQTDGFFDCISS